MRQPTTTYHTAHIWERGHRQINEDSLVVMDVVSGRKHILLAVVADGIGGLSEGEYAAGYVTGQLRSYFEEYVRIRDHITLNGLARLFSRVLYNCHHHLRDYGSQKAIHTGTTVSILCLIGRRGIAMHIGDSRLYLINDEIRRDGSKYGVEVFPHIHNHMLRHSFATRMREAGTDIKATADILGHTDFKITLGVYTNASQEFKSREISILDDYYRKEVE